MTIPNNVIEDVCQGILNNPDEWIHHVRMYGDIYTHIPTDSSLIGDGIYGHTTFCGFELSDHQCTLVKGMLKTIKRRKEQKLREENLSQIDKFSEFLKSRK